MSTTTLKTVRVRGGGIRGGNIVGRSDKEGGYVAENPVSPKDVLCTMYHLLGIDAHTTTVPDAQGRPYPLVAEGPLTHGLGGPSRFGAGRAGSRSLW